MELEMIRKVIASVLGVDQNEIEMETTFLGDLGADSLDLYQIVAGIEKELHITLSWDRIVKMSTVGEVVTLVKSSGQKTIEES